MPSSIDATKPVTGNPTTASVRANFAAAKAEIEALQSGKADLAGPALTGTTTAVNLTVTGTYNASGTFQLGGVPVTATAAELNKLDGVTASTAELNTLTGVTASAAEINKLVGLTPSTAELNYVDGVTSSIQAQLNSKADSASIVALAWGNITGTLSSQTDLQSALNSKADEGSAVSFTTVTIGSWTISDSGGKLLFNNGANRFSVDASGNIIADNNITAYGSP